MNALGAGITLAGLNGLLRLVQIFLTSVGSSVWLTLEIARWGLLVAMVVIFGAAVAELWTRVAGLEAKVAKHDETIKGIATEALFAKLELDVSDIENYAQKP